MLGIKHKIFPWYPKKKKKSYCIPAQQQASIGILHHYEEAAIYQKIQIIFEHILPHQKKKFLCYTSKPSAIYDPKVVLSHKSINLWGGIYTPWANSFLKESFNYLYFVAFDTTPVLNYLIQKSQAKCKVGYYMEKQEKYLDIMLRLHTAHTYENLITQMLRYTKMI